MKHNCPVCGAECKVYDDRTEGTTRELYQDCPNGCWSYHFAYGSHAEYVGDQEWTWHYTDTPEEMNRIQQEIKTATQSAKQSHDRTR